jgi:hypothetical protein
MVGGGGWGVTMGEMEGGTKGGRKETERKEDPVV